jgi:hypothetical protein
MNTTYNICRTGIIINRQRLRIAAMMLAFIFLGSVAFRIYEIISKA